MAAVSRGSCQSFKQIDSGRFLNKKHVTTPATTYHTQHDKYRFLAVVKKLPSLSGRVDGNGYCGT